MNGHGSVHARAYANGYGYCKQRKNSSACASQADERSGATYAASLLFCDCLFVLICAEQERDDLRSGAGGVRGELTAAYAAGLSEDAGRDPSLLQGKTTWAFQLGVDNPVCNRYGGPAPEDRPHEYELQLFALSEQLPLQQGFYYNEFLRAIRGKVLDSAVLRGVYPN